MNDDLEDDFEIMNKMVEEDEISKLNDYPHKYPKKCL